MQETEILNRVRKALAMKQRGTHNCAQAVACSYADITPLDEETIRCIAHAFGSGMATMEGTCGAIVGAGLIIGLVTGDRMASRAEMKKLMEGFRNHCGSTICKDLKGIGTGKVLASCPECIATATSLLGKFY